MPPKAVPLLKELNHIVDPDRDLRFTHHDYLLLPPKEVVESSDCHWLMQEGECLEEVFKRHGVEGVGGSGGVLEGEWWERFVEGNKWASKWGLKKKQKGLFQYLVVPQA
jgi:hypothetical protein